MIYLYAIAGEVVSSLDPPTGIENQGVYQINLGSFAPVLSTTLSEEITLSKEAIYRHEKVVEFYLEHSALLPVRFNTLFKNEEELVTTLKTYELEIETNLHKVSGCVEMGIKVLVKDSSRKNSNGYSFTKNISRDNMSKAKQYLLDKLSSYKESLYIQEIYKEQGESIYTSLNEYSRLGIKFPISSDSFLILNSAFLVPKESLSSFKNKFQEIKQTNTDLAFLLSGPWPPYSFVDFSIQKKADVIARSSEAATKQSPANPLGDCFVGTSVPPRNDSVKG